jgi:hypothetical protein
MGRPLGKQLAPAYYPCEPAVLEASLLVLVKPSDDSGLSLQLPRDPPERSCHEASSKFLVSRNCDIINIHFPVSSSLLTSPCPSSAVLPPSSPLKHQAPVPQVFSTCCSLWSPFPLPCSFSPPACLLVCIYIYIYFFAVLGFELRAYTLSHSTSPFVFV